MKKDKKKTSKKSTKKSKKTIKVKIDKKKILEKIKQKKVWIPAVAVLGLILLAFLLYPKITTKELPQPSYAEPPTKDYGTVELSGDFKITNYGPTGESRGQVQIKIHFNNPIIPLTTLSDEKRDSILNHFNLEPPIEGKFRILGTSGVVFEPEHSLPMSTTYTVTITKGIKDIAGNEIKEDFSWEFKTPLPEIRINPYTGAHHIKLDQEVHIQSNTSLDIKSLKSKKERMRKARKANFTRTA